MMFLVDVYYIYLLFISKFTGVSSYYIYGIAFKFKTRKLIYTKFFERQELAKLNPHEV